MTIQNWPMRKETFSQSHTRMWLDHDDLHGESFHQSRPSATMAIRKRYFFTHSKIFFQYHVRALSSRDFCHTVTQFEKKHQNYVQKYNRLESGALFQFRLLEWSDWSNFQIMIFRLMLLNIETRSKRNSKKSATSFWACSTNISSQR